VLEQLDGLGLEGLQIDPSHFPGDDAETLERLEAVTRKHGYYLEFGMGGWDVTRLAARIRLTARFGGRAVRTFCGDENTSPVDRRRYVELAAPALRHAGGVADAHDVDIAVENHGDFTSVELEELVRKVDHPRVGVCLDTGNSLFRDEEPLECARRLVPYTRSMHLKDWTMVKDPDGQAIWEEAVPGQGQVPVAEILELVASRQPELYIALETPVAPSGDEKETVAREWEHVRKSARAARKILDAL
jgi:sugar phosphate isomerase/epimerase